MIGDIGDGVLGLDWADQEFLSRERKSKPKEGSKVERQCLSLGRGWGWEDRAEENEASRNLITKGTQGAGGAPEGSLEVLRLGVVRPLVVSTHCTG